MTRFSLFCGLVLAGVALASCGPGSHDNLSPEVRDAGDETPGYTEGVSQRTIDLKALFPAWYESTEPFRIVGEVYYVGSAGLGMFLLPTEQGHILIDGGVPENAAQVLSNIRALGFDPADVRILLNTHAHFDHSGGLAELKRVTGAKLIASEGDRSALEGGFYLGSEDNVQLNAPPVRVDELIGDGETVSLGGLSLRANLTPGHTRGCTSWTFSVEEEGQSFEVLLFCSATVAANRLVGPPQYEGIVADYRATFARTREWTPDILLANHPEFFAMDEKRARQLAGDKLAFVDRGAFPRLIVKLEADFEVALAKAESTQAQE